MPLNKKTHTTVSTVIPKEKKAIFKKIAKSHYQSMAARIAYLIDKDIEEDQNKAK